MKLAVGVPKYGWIGDGQDNEGTDSGKPEDVKKLVESWRENHEAINVELKDEEGTVDVSSQWTFQ